MGMLGAMAGAGKGMQGFAGLMGEQRKMDWQSKQDQIKHERSMNLENLRASNTRTLAQDKMDFQGEQAGELRDYTTEQNELNRTSADTRAATAQGNAQSNIKLQDSLAMGRQVVGKDKSGVQVTASQYETMTPEQQKEVASPAQWQAEEALRQQDASFKQLQSLNAGVRNEKADKLEKMWSKDGLSATEQTKIFALRQGIDIKELVGTAKPMSAEMVKNIDSLLGTDEDYTNAGPEQKIEMVRDTYARLMGGGEGGGGTSLAEVQTAFQNGEVTEAEIQAEVKKGTITVKDAEEITGKVTLGRTSPDAPAGTQQGMMAGPVERNSMMSPPTGPERVGPNLGSMAYDKLKNTFQGLRDK